MKKVKQWHLWFLILPNGIPTDVFLSRRLALTEKHNWPLAGYRLAHLKIKPIKCPKK